MSAPSLQVDDILTEIERRMAELRGGLGSGVPQRIDELRVLRRWIQRRQAEAVS